MRGIQTEVDVERVFADPQGKNTSGESYWVRTQVMQEASSPKLGQDSLSSAKSRRIINDQVQGKYYKIVCPSNKKEVGDGWGNNILMQRDGTLIKIFPCGSANMFKGYRASKFWIL